jgi:peptidoglycan/xylan/chitin deacetylase (PgdA/CDA1 family)
MNKTAIRAGLNAAYFSGAHHLLRPFCGGMGAILTFHHVRPPRSEQFQPNRALEVSPAFLGEVIARIHRSGSEIISLEEMHYRLTEGDASRRFVCLTFDDGYRDNLTWAYPILKKYQAPFAIFIATSFADGLGDLWWLTLESVIAHNDWIAFRIGSQNRRFDCRHPGGKRRAFDVIYWWLHRLDSEAERRRVVGELARRHGVEMSAPCRELCLTWSELVQLAADPLVTIGAHTVNHIVLKKADATLARSEMQMSASAITARLGVTPRHFAYPYGNRAEVGAREFRMAAELGFKTAVTTRPGVLFADHRSHLLALPRIVLDGEFQHWRYVEMLLSGGPRALWTGFRRVAAA